MHRRRKLRYVPRREIQGYSAASFLDGMLSRYHERTRRPKATTSQMKMEGLEQDNMLYRYDLGLDAPVSIVTQAVGNDQNVE